MTQQGMPNSIELFESAVEYMIPVIAAVKSDQLSGSTPCTEWDVQALLNHNIKVARFVHSTIAGTGEVAMESMADVNVPLPSEGAAEAFDAATKKVLEAIKGAGMVEKVVETPFGPMPAGHFLMIPFSDIVIHRWDLAKGTGQVTSMDSSLAEACYSALAPAMEMARQGGFFGSEVTVPINASPKDKLLGLTGRQP